MSDITPYIIAQQVLDMFHISKEGHEGMTFPEWLDFKRGIKPREPFGYGIPYIEVPKILKDYYK